MTYAEPAPYPVQVPYVPHGGGEGKTSGGRNFLAARTCGELRKPNENSLGVFAKWWHILWHPFRKVARK